MTTPIIAETSVGMQQRQQKLADIKDAPLLMPQLLPLIERDHTAWLRMNLEGGRRPISLTAAKPGTLRQYRQAAWTVTALIPPRSPRTPSPPGLR